MEPASSDDTMHNGDSAPTTITAIEQDNDATSNNSARPLDRLKHFTWAWYTLPMSTGGLALLLSPSTQPHTFDGLDTVGKVVYIIDLIIFTLITISIIYRFIRWPSTLRHSLTHPTESLFFATSLLSLASIIACIARYGISSIQDALWLRTAYIVLFWLYLSITFIHAVAQYTLLFTSPLLKIEDMTPAWDLPIFPFMLSGTIASTGASAIENPSQAVPMIIAGLTAQGLGFLVSILMYASYIRRMVQFGFPGPNARPAMFIAVGPPSFTALALIGLANDFPVGYIDYFGVAGVQDPGAITAQVLRIMATVSAVFIWSLSVWFFCVAVVATILGAREMKFHLNWWAFVFPNVGFTIATISIGKMLKSEAMMWVGSVMSIGLVMLYLFVGVRLVVAVWRREILWDGKDEDYHEPVKKGKKEKLEKLGDVEKQD